jgi:hypothetical protein
MRINGKTKSIMTRHLNVRRRKRVSMIKASTADRQQGVGLLPVEFTVRSTKPCSKIALVWLMDD